HAEDRGLEPDEGALIAEALDSLPVATRACVWLHFAEGMGVREVAAAIGKGKSSAAERIRDGAERVRSFLRRKGSGLALSPSLGDVLLRLPAPDAPPTLKLRVAKLRPRGAGFRTWL